MLKADTKEVGRNGFHQICEPKVNQNHQSTSCTKGCQGAFNMKQQHQDAVKHS